MSLSLIQKPLARALALSGLMMVLSLALASEAHAVLAENQSSVSSVVDAISATRHDVETRGDGLTVHVISKAGLEIREFVADATGQVVGIAWSGAREPGHIDAILGRFTGEYVRGIRDSLLTDAHHVSIRGPMLRAQGEHVAIERYGRMGISRGRVYLLDLPPGVRADALR